MSMGYYVVNAELKRVLEKYVAQRLAVCKGLCGSMRFGMSSSVPLPNQARYQTSPHPDGFFLYGRRCGQTCGQRRFFDGFITICDCQKRRRVNGSRRFHFCAGRENIRAPKPSALPTALHPDGVMRRSPEGRPNALHCNTFPLLRQDGF